jgi:hypothetical protein
MNSETEKITVIRRHLSQMFPSWNIEDGSRTGVDRTLQLFEGVTLKSTVQIGMDLLRDTDRSQSDLERALQEKDIAGWLLSAPIVYLNNNNLGLNDGEATT